LRDHCGSLSYRWFCSAQTPVKDGRSTALQHLPKAQSGSPLHDQRFAEIDFTFDGAELPASQPGHLSEGAPQALPPQQRCLSRPCAPALCRAAAAPPRRAGRPGARGEAGPAARREKCFKLPIRNPDFPSEHLAHQVFGLFGGSADAFDRFYQGRVVQAKRAETVGQS